jgi:hypothetical protein
MSEIPYLTSNGKYTFLHFPEHWIEIQHEILTYHPELLKKLNNMRKDGEDNFRLITLMIAKHCEITLQGDYTILESSEVLRVCLNKLREKRPGKTGP